jgi:aerobic-type carbon monoxide dehydrogenase small subunit (CoxS/CutS family)
MTIRVNLRVNGVDHPVEIAPHETLGQVLNGRLGMNGVRISCEEGECGSCTVLVNDEAVNSCLMLAVQAEERDILTIEGLGTPDNLHPIQRAFVEEHGFQCGFCTPGFVLSSKALLETTPHPDTAAIATGLSGHICRCGTYPNIIRAVQRAAEDGEQEADNG